MWRRFPWHQRLSRGGDSIIPEEVKLARLIFCHLSFLLLEEDTRFLHHSQSSSLSY